MIPSIVALVVAVITSVIPTRPSWNQPAERSLVWISDITDAMVRSNGEPYMREPVSPFRAHQAKVFG